MHAYIICVIVSNDYSSMMLKFMHIYLRKPMIVLVIRRHNLLILFNKLVIFIVSYFLHISLITRTWMADKSNLYLILHSYKCNFLQYI